MEDMTSENAPVSYYSNDTGNGAAAALLAGIATKDNYNPVDMVAAGGICDLRHEVGETKYVVKDTEANIRRDIGDVKSDLRQAECQIVKTIGEAECSLTKDILETRHTLAKDILRAEYENKLAVQTAIKEINEKVDKESERTNDKVDFGFRETTKQMWTFEKSVDDKFCATQRLIEDGFKNNRIQHLEDKVFKQSQDLQTQTLKELICCGCGVTTQGSTK